MLPFIASARRLSRPSFASLAPLVSEPLIDNYAGAWAKTHLSNRQGLFGQQSENQLELGGPSDLLALSQNFGYVSFHNSLLYTKSGSRCIGFCF